MCWLKSCSVIRHDSTHAKFKNSKLISRDKNQSISFLWYERIHWEVTQRNFGGENMFYIFIWALVSWVCTELAKSMVFLLCRLKRSLALLSFSTVCFTLTPLQHLRGTLHFWPFWSPNVWEFFPHQVVCNTNRVTYTLIQSHRLRAPSRKPASIPLPCQSQEAYPQ